MSRNTPDLTPLRSVMPHVSPNTALLSHLKALSLSLLTLSLPNNARVGSFGMSAELNALLSKRK